MIAKPLFIRHSTVSFNFHCFILCALTIVLLLLTVRTRKQKMSSGNQNNTAAQQQQLKNNIRVNLDRCSNFMRQFRDPESRELTKLSANQFMDVWSHYDKDGNNQTIDHYSTIDCVYKYIYYVLHVSFFVIHFSIVSGYACLYVCVLILTLYLTALYTMGSHDFKQHDSTHETSWFLLASSAQSKTCKKKIFILK